MNMFNYFKGEKTAEKRNLRSNQIKLHQKHLILYLQMLCILLPFYSNSITFDLEITDAKNGCNKSRTILNYLLRKKKTLRISRKAAGPRRDKDWHNLSKVNGNLR